MGGGELMNWINDRALGVGVAMSGGELMNWISDRALGVGVPLSLGLAVVYLFSHYQLSRNLGNGLSLPRGNLWIIPVIGESLDLVMNYTVFFPTRIRKYGAVFSSHLFGQPTVVVTSHEAQMQVLSSPEHHFYPNKLPKSLSKILGPGNLPEMQGGQLHTSMRRLFFQRWKGENMSTFLPILDDIAKQSIQAFTGKGKITAYTEFKRYTFDVALISVLGDLRQSMSEMEALREAFDAVCKGFLSIPVDLPGTTYHKSLKAVESIRQLINETLDRREKASKDGVVYDDVMNDLVNLTIPGGGNEKLPREQLQTNVMVALTGATETTAATMTWLLHYLAGNPEILQEIIGLPSHFPSFFHRLWIAKESWNLSGRWFSPLIHKVEHQAIADSKTSMDYTLTYKDIVKMEASVRAFQETLRISGPSFGAFREANKDMELAGTFIPKGRKLVMPFSPIHRDPYYYPDPETFNPSRFKESPPKTGIFMAFGIGPRICPGADLAKVEVIIFLHRLVLNYRWELLEQSKEVESWFPFPKPKGGLPLRLIPAFYKSLHHIQA